MTELLDRNFVALVPEEIDKSMDLNGASATVCKFNRWGTLVAIGCTDGRVMIVDFITKNISRVFTAHSLSVSTLSWSRNGRKLLTSSADMTVAVFDVLAGALLYRNRFTSVVTFAMFNPRNDNKAVVLSLNMATVEQFSPKIHRVIVNDIPGASDDSPSCLTYDRKAKYIITGTGKGKIIIYNAETLKVVAWCKQNSVQQIRQIYVPIKSKFIITNTQDRIIRTYVLEDLLTMKGATVEAVYKVQDLVNKTAWKSVCTDMGGSYICGASTKSYSLYIWESITGSLIKILHGKKGEALQDVQWHPTRPVIISIATGIVSIWNQANVENWSAFAPDFLELEENEKYKETEGEFDMEDEDDDNSGGKNDQAIEEDLIDVVNLKREEYMASSDEEDLEELKPDVTLRTGPLWYIPQAPDSESVEQQNAMPESYWFKQQRLLPRDPHARIEVTSQFLEHARNIQHNSSSN